eukprot:6821263-Karenia_brevis.AAC.1
MTDQSALKTLSDAIAVKCKHRKPANFHPAQVRVVKGLRQSGDKNRPDVRRMQYQCKDCYCTH